MSFPVWLVLVAMIAGPVHFSVGKLRFRGWAHYMISAIVTMTITTFAGLIDVGSLGAGPSLFADLRQDFATSVLLGALFGGPIGLIFSMIVAPAREDSFRLRRNS